MRNIILGIIFAYSFLLPNIVQSGEVEKMAPKRAQFIILVDDDKSFDRPSGENFIAKNVLIKDVDSKKFVGYYYRDTEIAFSDLESIEIVIKKGDSYDKIHWSYIDLNNLVEYLRKNIQRDCGGFASFIKEGPVRKWNGYPDILFQLPGDVIGLSENENCSKIIHYALNLKDNLYISDYGSRTDLVVSTLEQLQEVYPSKFVCLLNPLEKF